MAKFDGTGPMGMGSMTGRGMGPCAMGFGGRKRFGMGRGLGRYFNWNSPQSVKDQKQALTDYVKALEEELEDTKKELKELE